MTRKYSIKTVELFAGVGGFRLALENIKKNNKSFNVVWSNQWEPSTKKQHAAEIYKRHFGCENFSNENISNVDIDDIPNHDMLVCGFPCQDYSVANTLKNTCGINGKKGILWWEIYRILQQKKDKSPKYLLFENVDRLLKSPTNQRGRDFAIMLSSLNALGYAVEWRVINASDYGMPQRRKRIFIFGSKRDTIFYNNLKTNSIVDNLNDKGLFAKSFPIEHIDIKDVITKTISGDLVDITNNFNKTTSKNNPFSETGYMINDVYHTSKIVANYNGEYSVLGDVLENENNISEEFYINNEELKKWKYLKGHKSIERINKTTGYKYTYSEGNMEFPDSLDKPARTIITSEGGASPSRFKHVVKINGRYRRLTPIELEQLNMFPKNFTKDISDTKRAFLMGNALVVGIVEKLGNVILEELN